MNAQTIPHEDLLRPGTGPLWLQAMSLPTLPWVRPFLGRMGFPPELMLHLDTLGAVAAQAGEKRAQLWATNEALGYFPELDAHITREFVGEALDQLAAAVSPATANAYKAWAMRNVVDETVHGALLAWRVILRSALVLGSPGYRVLPPPEALIQSLLQVEDLVKWQAREQLHAELVALSPPYHDDAGVDNDLSPEAMTVEEIITDVQTQLALNTLARLLSPSQQAEAIVWAEKQAAEQKIATEVLQGNRFWHSD